MSRHAVLISSADPLAAALLAAAVELAGAEPFFIREGESARNALRRVRPRLVMIDCDHEETCRDEFIGPSLMMQAKVLLFRSPLTRHDVKSLAKRLSLPVLDLPFEHEDFSELLGDLLG